MKGSILRQVTQCFCNAWVSVLFLRALLIAGAPSRDENCKKECANLRMPSTFRSPTGQIPMFFTKCEIKGGAECSLDLGPWIQPLANSSTVQYYLAIVCRSSTRIIFCNSPEVKRKNVISFYQMAGPCSVTVHDVSVLGNATDYRVQLFTHGAELLYADTESITGLRNIGTFSLQSSGTGIPRILTGFEWPRMAEVLLSNLSITEIPEQFKTAMPRLQALDLNNNSLTRPPDFPWSHEPLSLPRNLSRLPVFNHHYQEGSVVQPRLYRRFLVLDYNQIRNLSQYPFTGHLQKLSIKGNGLRVIGGSCFSNLSGVNIIDLSNNEIRDFPEQLFRGQGSMLELRLNHNFLSTLPNRVFTDMKRLKRLYLNNNRLQRLQAGLLYGNEEIETLTLNDNDLTEIENNALPENSNTLKTLTLQRNRLTRVPRAVFLLRNLESADLSSNAITFGGILDVLDSVTADQLFYNLRRSASSSDNQLKSTKVELNLANNGISSIDIGSLNKTQLGKLKVILRVYHIDLRDNPLICNCKLTALFRLLKRLTADYPDVTHAQFDSWICSQPTRLRNVALLRVPENQFQCIMDLENCPRECTCAVREIDQTVLVDCSERGLHRLPFKMPAGELEVNLRGNAIRELPWRHYLGNITVLELSNNEIKELNMTFVDSLARVVNLAINDNKLKYLSRGVTNLTAREGFRSLSISHNFFVCDCYASWMRDWLANNTDKIEDTSSILCASGRLEGLPIISVPLSDFNCSAYRPPVPGHITDGLSLLLAIVLAVLLVLSVVAFVMTYCFRWEMKILMYTHFNWHPFDRVDDTDVSKIYDTFISYSSQDASWVRETLQRTLESHVPPYRLCIHDRDFEIGASIHDNILNSVRLSKRMIMVLSNHFIASEWCRLEFRAAHQKVLEDRTNYLIIILFDDVDPSTLDDETKLYLRTNTYLSVSNKWFWQKLFYALPKPLAPPQSYEGHVEMSKV
ncbi:protein toll [Nematostella vectensis]|nr:protein toll [Nematostella vectensis]